MRLKEHVVYGGILSIILAPIFGIYSVFFWVASFLIDADHYLEFLYKNGFRDWKAKNMYAYFEAVWRNAERKNFLDMQILHTAEAFIILYILIKISGQTVAALILNSVFWGMLFHIVLDALFSIKHKILFKRAFSLTDYFIRRNLMSKKGINPDWIHEEALKLYKNENK